MDTQSYVEDVGAISQKYSIQDDSKMAGYILIALGVLFVPGGIVMGLGGNLAQLGSGILGSICGVTMGLVGIAVTIWRVRSASTTYVVGDAGIAKITGKSKVVVKWDRLREYRQRVVRKIFFSGLGMMAFSVYDCSFLSDDGVSLTMGDRLKDVSPFVQDVWGKVTRYLTPKFLDRLNRGESVSFGRINLNKTTLTIDSSSISLESLDSIQITSGNVHFRLHKDGKVYHWFKMPAAEVVNLPVFVELLREGGPIGKLKGPISLDQEKLWTGFN